MIYHTRRSCQFLIIILTILGINLFILFKFLHFKLTELTINIQFKALKTCFLFLEMIVITPLPEKNFRNVNFQSINSVLLGSSPLQFFKEILGPCLPPPPLPPLLEILSPPPPLFTDTTSKIQKKKFSWSSSSSRGDGSGSGSGSGNVSGSNSPLHKGGGRGHYV